MVFTANHLKLLLQEAKGRVFITFYLLNITVLSLQEKFAVHMKKIKKDTKI